MRAIIRLLRNLREGRKLVVGLLLVSLTILTSGCVTMQDPEASQEFRADAVATVSTDTTLGQTFVSRRASLNGLQLWLRPEPSESAGGGLEFRLYHAAEDQQPLVTIPLSHGYIASNEQVNLTFPALHDPAEQKYYFTLSSRDDHIQVMGRNDDAYFPGGAFLNGASVQADIAFRTSYDYNFPAVLLDLRRVVASGWLVFPLLILLWLPGRLLLQLTHLEKRFDGGERLGLSLGLSLASVPVLMTWTTLLGLHWNGPAVWIAAMALLALYVWSLRNSWHNLHWPRWHPSWIGIGLGLVFIASLAVRFAMVRDLSVPPWVDSVHHAMIARLIVEDGGFPPSYAPYVDIETASYHAGFHSLVASFHWLTGLDIPGEMLLLGQVLNALAVVAVYLFTTTYTRNRPAGLAAALIAGLMTPMPAYYTSWGRYTQLAGLLILPTAVALIKLVIEQPDWRKTALPLAALAAGGLFLTHYRVIAFLAALLLADMAVQSLAGLRHRQTWQELPGKLGWLLLAAFMAVVLTAPWWPATLRTLLIPKLGGGGGSAGQTAWFSDFSWGYLDSALGKYALYLAAAGCLLGILLRQAGAWILPLWGGLMFLSANLGALGLPGGSLINNTSVEITLFMPLATLGGALIGWPASWAAERLPPRSLLPARLMLFFAASLVAISGARSLLPLLNPTTMLFREADRPAMSWIQANIPKDATVLVNPLSWGYGIYAGADGGYWITPMAERKTLPPPILYGLSNEAAQYQAIAESARQVVELSNRPQELHEYLLKQDIRYIYLGERGGPLSAKVLKGPLFNPLYHYANTWVFEVAPNSP